jgi:hypothetical protein
LRNLKLAVARSVKDLVAAFQLHRLNVEPRQDSSLWDRKIPIA